MSDHVNWPDRLYTLISESPGIYRNELCSRTQKLSAGDRVRYIDELISAGRIRCDVVQGPTKPSKRYWAIHADEAADPQQALIVALEAAQRRCRASLDCVEAALSLARQARDASAATPAAPGGGGREILRKLSASTVA